VKSLDELLPLLVRQTEDSPQAREHAVFTAWWSAAGAAVRRFSTPLRLDGRRLIVATVDETWRAQLHRLGPQFIFKMSSLLGAPLVTQLAFRVDPEAVARAHDEATRPVVVGDPAAHAEELAADAAAIADPALRATFLRAASKCLARAEQTKDS
jgi:hypothetical protein